MFYGLVPVLKKLHGPLYPSPGRQGVDCAMVGLGSSLHPNPSRATSYISPVVGPVFIDKLLAELLQLPFQPAVASSPLVLSQFTTAILNPLISVELVHVGNTASMACFTFSFLLEAPAVSRKLQAPPPLGGAITLGGTVFNPGRLTVLLTKSGLMVYKIKYEERRRIAPNTALVI